MNALHVVASACIVGRGVAAEDVWNKDAKMSISADEVGGREGSLQRARSWRFSMLMFIDRGPGQEG